MKQKNRKIFENDAKDIFTDKSSDIFNGKDNLTSLVTQDSNGEPDIDKTAVVVKTAGSQPITKKDPFETEINAVGWERDKNGVYYYRDNQKIPMTNFSVLEYLYNIETKKGKVRVVKMDGEIYHLTAQELINPTSMKKLLLSKSNLRLEMDSIQFHFFSKIILKLDNKKYLKQTNGFGRVSDNIFHLGNMVFIDDHLEDFKDTFWLNKQGYSLQPSDKIQVSANPFSPDVIWGKMFKLYGMDAVLLTGFATATCFFKTIMKKHGSFPPLFVQGGSGRGKTRIAEFCTYMFGLDPSYSTINISTTATKPGIETKSLLFNNLPIIFNELDDDHFKIFKSRYDGQGSVKFDENSSNNLKERSVNGSTIVTTVVKPYDKQIISRCIFVDMDQIEMKKSLFDDVLKQAERLSGFIVSVLHNIKSEMVLTVFDQLKQEISYSGNMPRVFDNYVLIGASFMVFHSLLNSSVDVPSRAEIVDFLIHEMNLVEEKLNPLTFFINELERFVDQNLAEKYITQDGNYLYINFNGVWSKISAKYKNKYFPHYRDSDIKDLLKKSQYMELYNNVLETKDPQKADKPAYNVKKKISGVVRSCYVLRIDKMPGYFR
jgi:hypothetical protein